MNVRRRSVTVEGKVKGWGKCISRVLTGFIPFSEEAPCGESFQ